MKRHTHPLYRLALLVLVLLVGFMCVLVENRAPEPQPSPLPTQSLRARNYAMFLPRVDTAPRKGLGLTYGNCGDVNRVGATWFYKWGPWPRDCEGVESVPMIWGQNDIGKTPRGTSIWLLGFNEPDRANQANLTPDAAAELWREVERLYGEDWKLVSPAVAHTDVDWLRRFVASYQLRYDEMPQLDALAVHCYANSVAQCIAVVEEVIGLAEKWGTLGGVWLTEFSFWPVGAEEVSLALDRARRFIGWMGGEHQLRRYAWFAARMRGDEWWMGPSTALVEFDGSELTMYGEMYKGE